MKRILFIVAFFFTLISITSAQSPVTLLSPLPGVMGGAVSFDDYVPLVFKLAIGVAGVLAVIMIIIGGLQYMSTDAITGKSEGRNKITSALIGLVLVLAAYIILQQINPALVQFGLPGIPVIVTTTAVPPSGGPPPRYTGSGPTMSAATMKARLAATNPYDPLINHWSSLARLPTERIKSMMAIESAGILGARSPAGALGLMQVKPATAQDVLRRNPLLARTFGVNANDAAAVSNLLLTNAEANVAIGTTYYAEGYRLTGSLDDASAFYNGGPGALAPSVDCPGMKKYQCGINPGGYVQTQNYINNIHAMETYLRTGSF